MQKSHDALRIRTFAGGPSAQLKTPRQMCRAVSGRPPRGLPGERGHKTPRAWQPVGSVTIRLRAQCPRGPYSPGNTVPRERPLRSGSQRCFDRRHAPLCQKQSEKRRAGTQRNPYKTFIYPGIAHRWPRNSQGGRSGAVRDKGCVFPQACDRRCGVPVRRRQP